MTVAWVTPADVALFLGVPQADAADDEWLAQSTAAANAVAFRRRAAAGYTDDAAVVPDDAVKSGTVLYAGALYRERGAVDGFASFTELGAFIPAGGSWGQIQRLWGVNRMAVG